ncbi:hypothetical protein RMONA_06260 [Rickettsia monacensis]|uniref:Uncharacterized protein n=1 Tax=Rickettsia monacensis TaxID=109232 RepID=A0A0B7J0L1_9RICK|nr:hypothetical protein RMONA_7135 [Rickettsia monacensis IrR/Munich]CEO17611.1 hypothetical protein RMONA_06260 [Rickettsia monacensis]
MSSPIVPGLVAWIEKPTRCHSRVALLRGSKNAFGVIPWLGPQYPEKQFKILKF